MTAINSQDTASYTYDLFQRRVSKTIDGVITNYLSDGNQEIAEYDSSGNVLRRYIWGAGIDDLVAMVDVQNNNYGTYYVHDARNSIVFVGDYSGNYYGSAGGGFYFLPPTHFSANQKIENVSA